MDIEGFIKIQNGKDKKTGKPIYEYVCQSCYDMKESNCPHPIVFRKSKGRYDDLLRFYNEDNHFREL